MADKHPTVLFVEDVADTRNLVEFSLEQDGFAVTAVQTAVEGLALARANEYAVILLDVGLHDMDGLALCHEIRSFNQTTPVLFYTAFAELLDEAEALRAGAQGILRKPEDTNRLGAVIRKLIEAHS
jgi:DNA-binding response OmpR family regulator